ncbi:MAG: universal stress protein [Desulfobacterales bacterium]|uniref:Universal stress protein n=1 Tax=Candidatus Desulfatibia vada TaxID=2841696 RepID=A0A8J6NW40_9BACT|nr:universal stress protein [Candidatus Desulfatibia vada]MBL6970752.1 universal stress protein [Desulfobacterales bacterium]
MRILVALDQHSYSNRAVREAAKLAMNTWADVTLLGICPKTAPKRQPSKTESAQVVLEHPITNALGNHRQEFLGYFQGKDSPYNTQKSKNEFVEVKRHVWEELFTDRGAIKDLKIRIRQGNPAKAILAESYEEGIDLVVIGCDKDKKCLWENAANVPQKIANDAPCSVLVVKEEATANKIVCCLDHDTVSQNSLEMINQMVTFHKAELEIIGLTEGARLKVDVEKKVDAILQYYTARQLMPLIQLVEPSAFESFVSREAQRSLMALWMGEKSILEKIFPPKKVGKLVRTSQSSVLILR